MSKRTRQQDNSKRGQPTQQQRAQARQTGTPKGKESKESKETPATTRQGEADSDASTGSQSRKS